MNIESEDREAGCDAIERNLIEIRVTGWPMAITVPGRGIQRFELRWFDYCEVVANGTPEVVGHSQPALIDRRDEMLWLWQDPGAVQPDVGKANKLLDSIWGDDAGLWQRRLAPFLERLGTSASRAFSALVAKGYQPDTLAHAFHHAADVRALEMDEAHVRSGIRELQRLIDAGEQALRALLNRKQQFDEYQEHRRLRALYDEPGSAELKILVSDFADWAGLQRADLARLQRHTDRRHGPFTGHALVRLSTRIHQITGAYHDGKVAAILNAIWAAERSHRTTSPANLRARRARWHRLLEGRS